MFNQIIRSIKRFIDYNPILNPDVVRIQPIRTKDRKGNLVTVYRLSTRKHFFDSYKVIGEFKSFMEAVEESLK